ncbi:acetyltransferase, GNAT family [Trichophyton rubrum]|uniref:Acetyltransferase, GNAT family n=1 Tax=Trichophyton rubrum TaxID=5551 RepID=A0A178EXT7_TRIRU|nr:acetyltransferase, GNAT family [Trichophyton rubrum]
MLVEIRRMTKEDIPGAIECVQTGFADDPYFNWVFDVSKKERARYSKTYMQEKKNISRRNDQADHSTLFRGPERGVSERASFGCSLSSSSARAPEWLFDKSLLQFSKDRNDVSLTNRCLWGIKNGLFYVAREVPSASDMPDDQKGLQEPHERTSLLRDKSSSASPARVVGVAMWLLPQPRSKPDSWFTYFQTWLLSFRQLLTNIRFMGRGGLRVQRYRIWKEAQANVQDELWTDERGYYFCNVVAVRPEVHGKGIGRQLVNIVTQQADEEGINCYLESSKQVPNIQIYERFGFKLIRDMVCDDNGETCKLYCMIREPKSQS